MRIYDGRESFYQWDLNQKITSDAFEVGDEIHFFNIRQAEALIVKAYDLGGIVVADVPNILLQTAQPVTAWKYVCGEHSAQTVMEDTFRVNQRPQPADYSYTETDLYELRKEVVDAISELDDIEESLTTKEQARVDAEEERASNESDRIVAEVERENAEEDRVDAEAIRVANETSRKKVESQRVIAEQSRVEAEQNRESAEQERIVAEEIRQAKFESLSNNIGNAIKGSASGEIVRLDDVSPVEHTAKAKVSGKNLLPPFSQDYSNSVFGVTQSCSKSGQTITLDGTVSGGGGGRNIFVNVAGVVKLEKGKVYTLKNEVVSGSLDGSISTYLNRKRDMTPVVSVTNGGSTKTFTASASEECFVGINSEAGSVYESVVVRFQLEEGDTATEYEPYIDPTTVTLTVQDENGENIVTYTPAADGTCEVASVCPVMELSTDIASVNIEVEYNQDANKAMDGVKADVQELDDVVASLIESGSGGESWRLIRDDTLTEEASSYKVSTDADGNPFALKKVMVEVYADTSQGVYTTGHAYLSLCQRNTDATWASVVYVSNPFPTTDGKKSYIRFDAEVIGTNAFITFSAHQNTGGFTYTQAVGTERTVSRAQVFPLDDDNIAMLRVDKQNEMNIGTRIVVWGVDA